MHQAEAPGVALQPLGERIPAHVGHPHDPVAGDDHAAGQDGIAGVLLDRQGLTGEEGLVDLEPGIDLDVPVRDHLVPRVQLEHVVDHHRLDGQFDGLTLPDGVGGGSGEDGQAVEGPLGPQLLEDTGDGVDHHHDGEDAVLDGPHDEDDDEEHAEDGVEPGGHVGPQDLGHRPAGGRVRHVGPAVRQPGSHLLEAQPDLGRDGLPGAGQLVLVEGHLGCAGHEGSRRHGSSGGRDSGTGTQ